MKYVPSLDKNFSPIILKIREFNELVKKASEVSHLTICLERNQGYNYFYEISEEDLEEVCEANEYEFLADGTIF